jgi:pantoate--beta-alanine ligase
MSAAPIPPFCRDPAEMRQVVRAWRAEGKKVGLVPTMGALHEGHLSLVEAARKQCDAVVVSIFVNPTQFGPSEDLAKYPRTLEADLALLAPVGVECVFAPSVEAMYPAGYSTFVEPPQVAVPLEGHCRPGHFRGVATIVLKLFEIVPADVAFFGQKDYQQSLVVRRMARDLDVPIEIEVCATIREPDGLALSSRNRYLSPAERRQALALSRALRAASDEMARGERSASVLRAMMRDILHGAGIERIDYVAIADPETLDEIATLKRPALALLACHVGTTRLIDNAPLG